MASIVHSGGTITFDVVVDRQTLDKPALATDRFVRKGIDLTARLPDGTREVPAVIRVIEYDDDAADAKTYRDALTDIINENVTYNDQFGRQYDNVWVIDVQHLEMRSVLRPGFSGEKIRTVSQITLARTE